MSYLVTLEEDSETGDLILAIARKTNGRNWLENW